MQMKFEVYYLDMYQDEGVWVENNRFRLGTLTVDSVIGEPDEDDVLKALCDFEYTDIIGRRIKALDREHLSVVYINQGWGDVWLEVCLQLNDLPIYGLKIIEEEKSRG